MRRERANCTASGRLLELEERRAIRFRERDGTKDPPLDKGASLRSWVRVRALPGSSCRVRPRRLKGCQGGAARPSAFKGRAMNGSCRGLLAGHVCRVYLNTPRLREPALPLHQNSGTDPTTGYGETVR